MPVGASLERSDDKVRQVEEIVRGFSEVKTVSTQVGGQGQGFAVGRNQATLNIALTERHERKRSQKEVEDAMRKAIAKVPGIEASLGFDRPIYVAILGNDPEELARIATDFTEQVKKIPGIADIDLSVKPGIPAYAVRLKPGAVRELGLTAPQTRVEPARLRERRDRHLLDHARRRADRGAGAAADHAARTRGPDARAAGGILERRRRRFRWKRWPTSSRCSTPT